MPAADSTDVWSPPASRFGILTGLPHGWFDFILADPPWPFATRSPKGHRKSPEAHYSTMSIDEIAAVEVDRVTADTAVLFLCCTWQLLLDREDPERSPIGRIIKAWGFRFATGGAWVKLTRNGKVVFGTGYRIRGATEPWIIATRGSPETSKAHRNLIESIERHNAIEGERREHSRKPESMYAWCEAYLPKARRLELFSRTSRPGWVGAGDQAGKWSVL